MPLVRGIQNVGLLAEESIALIDHILDYFGTRTPVFNPKRGSDVIRVIISILVCHSASCEQRLLLMLTADTILVMELGDQAV